MHFANRSLENEFKFRCEGTKTGGGSLPRNAVSQMFAEKEVTNFLLSGEEK
jgi:hypothetical protein